MLRGIVAKYAMPKKGRTIHGSIMIPAIITAAKINISGTNSDFIETFLKENRGIRLIIRNPISNI